MILKHPHVVIIGAGIVGASLAYHLAGKHAHVTLIDKATGPGNDATGNSFAWLTAGYAATETYLRLRQQAIADWHRVEDELKGELTIDWPGALTWQGNVAGTERTAHELINSGYPVRLVDQQEIRRLEPNLKEVPPLAMFAQNEGAIDPVLTTALFVKAAQEAGADIQLGNKVLSLITNGSRIAGVLTENGNLTADVVVMATGADANALCQPVGLQLPVNVSPAILMKFQNTQRFVNRIVSNPFMEIRAASDTLTLAAEDYIDDSTENNPQAIAQRTLEEIKKHWQGTGQIELINVMVGRRPIPRDGLPIIGRPTNIDGFYLAIMHAGVTLAAVAGRLIAAEIISEQDESLLSAYRPAEFG